MDKYCIDSGPVHYEVEANSKEEAFDLFQKERVLTREAVERCIDRLDEVIQVAREE